MIVAKISFSYALSPRLKPKHSATKMFAASDAYLTVFRCSKMAAYMTNFAAAKFPLTLLYFAAANLILTLPAKLPLT